LKFFLSEAHLNFYYRMDIATFEIEKELLGQGYSLVLGVDEAGRGPLAGPVVAAAVLLKNSLCHSGLDPESRIEQDGIKILKQVQDDKYWNLVRDSKKLSEKQREKVFDFIHENFHVGIGLCNHETIDHINILEASFLAMKKAVQNLKREIEKEKKDAALEVEPPIGGSTSKSDEKCIVLVDGNKAIPNFSMEQKAIIGGDRLVKSIAAASIVAKVTRDRMMMEAHEKYPQYGFDKHKGYGTKLHMDTLIQYGPCEIHRKSFAPVKKCLK